MFGFILTMLVIGLIAGAVARLVVPGRQPFGIGGTIVLGIAGSLIGGLVAYLIHPQHHAFAPSGLLGAILGAIAALLVYRSAMRRRGFGGYARRYARPRRRYL